MPRTMAGKKEAAANPKANATTAATNPGGLIPKYPAMITAMVAAPRAVHNSPFSDILGTNIFFTRAWGTEAEIPQSNPAPGDKAGANAPAATRAMTQAGRLAISGLARTIISLSMVISFL